MNLQNWTFLLIHTMHTFLWVEQLARGHYLQVGTCRGPLSTWRWRRIFVSLVAIEAITLIDSVLRALERERSKTSNQRLDVPALEVHRPTFTSALRLNVMEPRTLRALHL